MRHCLTVEQIVGDHWQPRWSIYYRELHRKAVIAGGKTPSAGVGEMWGVAITTAWRGHAPPPTTAIALTPEARIPYTDYLYIDLVLTSLLT